MKVILFGATGMVETSASAPQSKVGVALWYGTGNQLINEGRISGNAAGVLLGASAGGWVQAANSGHPGMPMGMADVATVLFSEHLRFDPTDPQWPDRDRFILSAGHGSMLLYSLLHLTGYPLDMEQLRTFRQFGSHTAGHPEVDPHLGRGIA